MIVYLAMRTEEVLGIYTDHDVCIKRCEDVAAADNSDGEPNYNTYWAMAFEVDVDPACEPEPFWELGLRK